MSRITGGSKGLILKLKGFLKRGGNINSICKYFKCTPQAVYNWMYRGNIPIEKRRDLKLLLGE